MNKLPKQIVVKPRDQYFVAEVRVIRNWGIERMGDSPKRLVFPIGQWLWCIRFKQHQPNRYYLNTHDSTPNDYTRVEGVGETLEQATESVFEDLAHIEYLDRSIVSPKHLEEYAERARAEQELRMRQL